MLKRLRYVMLALIIGTLVVLIAMVVARRKREEKLFEFYVAADTLVNAVMRDILRQSAQVDNRELLNRYTKDWSGDHGVMQCQVFDEHGTGKCPGQVYTLTVQIGFNDAQEPGAVVSCDAFPHAERIVGKLDELCRAHAVHATFAGAVVPGAPAK